MHLVITCVTMTSLASIFLLSLLLYPIQTSPHQSPKEVYESALLQQLRENSTACDGFNPQVKWQDTGKQFPTFYEEITLDNVKVNGIAELRKADGDQVGGFHSSTKDDEELVIIDCSWSLPSLIFETRTLFRVEKEKFSLPTNFTAIDDFVFNTRVTVNVTDGGKVIDVDGPSTSGHVEYNVTVSGEEKGPSYSAIGREEKDMQSFVEDNFGKFVTKAFLDTVKKFLLSLSIKV